VKYTKSKAGISSYRALRQGFLTNLLNPTAALFFISLFSQFISADTTIVVRVEYAVINWTIAFGWYCFLAYLITGKFLAKKVERFRGFIDRGMGFILMLLGVRMAFI
jgi:threonine/homoserine/homoserine lactone efflux protein